MALDAAAPSSAGGGEAEAVRPLLSAEEAEELDATYAPYARRDAYGTMGRGPLPVPRRVELFLRAVLLVPLRFVAGMLLLVTYYLVCRVCTLFVDEVAEEGRPRLRGWRRVAVVRAGQGLSRAMLFVFGFYWIPETHRSFPNAEDVHQANVSDAFLFNESPKLQILKVSQGTTTNGDYLLPFRTGAFLARVPVQPVILRYPYTMFSPAWDSMDGARHVFLLLCQFVNYIEVVRLPVYCPSEQEKEDPKLYANNVRKLIATEGNLILSNLGLAEKRVYHAALNGNSRAIHQKDD
uniref:Phospholipid/glycerol acyltransferase domain-containing protein n=1 Tax=Oryza punctata TaxID=4537 RepID=A0A0E0JHM8_ORYPU